MDSATTLTNIILLRLRAKTYTIHLLDGVFNLVSVCLCCVRIRALSIVRSFLTRAGAECEVSLCDRMLYDPDDRGFDCCAGLGTGCHHRHRILGKEENLSPTTAHSGSKEKSL